MSRGTEGLPRVSGRVESPAPRPDTATDPVAELVAELRGEVARCGYCKHCGPCNSCKLLTRAAEFLEGLDEALNETETTIGAARYAMTGANRNLRKGILDEHDFRRVLDILRPMARPGQGAR